MRAEAEAMVGCAAGPKANIDEIVRLSNQFLTGTEIPRDILDDVKRLVAGQIRERASDPDTKAQQTFLTALWAPHPYVQALLPSAERVQRASSADLADSLKANLALARLKVCVVGDLDEGQAASLVDRLFDNLPTCQPIGTLPDVEFLAPSRETIRVSTNDQHQAFIGVGGRSIPVSNPTESLAVRMLAFVLARDENARLFREIRDAKRATYVLQYRFDFFSNASLFVVFGAVAKEGSQATIAAMRNSIDMFMIDGPTAAEDRAARAAFSVLMDRLNSNASALAYELTTLLLFGWSVDDIKAIERTMSQLSLRKTGITVTDAKRTSCSSC